MNDLFSATFYRLQNEHSDCEHNNYARSTNMFENSCFYLLIISENFIYYISIVKNRHYRLIAVIKKDSIFMDFFSIHVVAR